MTRQEILSELKIMSEMADDIDTLLDCFAEIMDDYHSCITYLIDRIKND